MSAVVDSEHQTAATSDGTAALEELLGTPIGVYPNEWRIAPLGSVSAFITKGSTPTTFGFRWQSDGVLFLRSECVAAEGLDLRQSMFISGEAHEFLSRSEVHGGDILITITGNVGRVVLLDDDFGSANINQHIARIRINEPGVVPAYVHHFLGQPWVRNYYASITTGQAYPQISLKQVRETPIVLPDEAEQRAIASALSDVDALIDALGQIIHKKRAMKAAVLQELLTARRRLPGFANPWRSCQLGDLGTFTKGKGIRREDVVDVGIPCARYGEIYTRYHDYVETLHSRVSLTVAATALPILQGDILFAATGETAAEIGKCVAYVGEAPACAGGDIIVFRPSECDSVFLGHLLNAASVQKQKKTFAQGDAVVHISATNLACLRLDLPPLPEQQAIAAVLTNIDQEIVAIRRRRDKMIAIKQGMAEALLSGRVRLPGVAVG